MLSPAEPPQNIFVVRFWWEWSENESPSNTRWRGRVEHLPSGEGVTFFEMRQLIIFIQRFVTASETKEDER